MDEISRMEKILRGDPIEPITRLEKFCAKAAGTYTGDPLTPVTRLEWFLDQISGGGGGETKSTLIMSSPTLYTGERHYSSATYQQFTAPEGIVYDKVWNNDEYCSQRYFYIKHVTMDRAVATNMFSEMPLIETICLLAVNTLTTIWASAFNKCTALNKLAIYKSSGVVALNNINAFSNTPFASGGSGGTLYVPSALISSYQSASNWSTILGYANNSIQAIEGSEFQA